MKQSVIYNAAIYCRLSKDDLSHGVSSSIQTQKAMLMKYISDNNWHIVDYYVDDGSAARRLSETALRGYKTRGRQDQYGRHKDLSPFGHDYLKTVYYTEVYFPENNVRYIALNDGIDTLNTNNECLMLLLLDKQSNSDRLLMICFLLSMNIQCHR
jgi:DNA invertase Pin-like site-specific DNA recombinase